MTRRLMMLATVVAGLAACGGGGGGAGGYGAPTGTTSTTSTNPAPTTENTINANDAIVFNPTSLTVAVGTTVTFNFQSTTHDVVFAAGAGSPGDLGPLSNTSKSVTFSTAGSYPFRCSIHPNMTGTITVH